MRRITLCLLLGLLGLCGCQDAKKTVVDEPLVPTARELDLLQTYQMFDPTTEKAQRKLRRYRQREAKLAAAQERVNAWAAESVRRRKADGEEEERVPLNGLYNRR